MYLSEFICQTQLGQDKIIILLFSFSATNLCNKVLFKKKNHFHCFVIDLLITVFFLFVFFK